MYHQRHTIKMLCNAANLIYNTLDQPLRISHQGTNTEPCKIMTFLCHINELEWLLLGVVQCLW